MSYASTSLGACPACLALLALNGAGLGASEQPPPAGNASPEGKRRTSAGAVSAGAIIAGVAVGLFVGTLILGGPGHAGAR